MFTMNGYGKADMERLDTLDVGYIIYGKEVGESGNSHLQGYVELKNAKTLSSMKNFIGGGAHLETRKGTGKEASEYCKKEGDYVERGEMKNENGVRKDYKQVHKYLKDGGKIKDLLEEEEGLGLHMLQYAQKLLPYVEKKRDWKTEILWLWGPTGTGKSKYCHDTYPDAYWKSMTCKWWDGYDGQEVVILDDFRGDFCKFADLLRLFDRYPYMVEFKGGSRQMVAKTIVVTCPVAWTTIYKDQEDERIDQLRRRIERTVPIEIWNAQATLGNTDQGVPSTE